MSYLKSIFVLLCCLGFCVVFGTEIWEPEVKNLTCSVRDGLNHPLTVSWSFHGNDFITILNGKINISCVYSCVDEDDMQLWDKSPRDLMQRDLSKQAPLGSNFKQRCLFLAYPTAELFVMKNGVNLTNNSDYEIRKFHTGQQFHVIDFTIKNFTEQHKGTYGFHARNELGSAKFSVTLNVSAIMDHPADHLDDHSTKLSDLATAGIVVGVIVFLLVIFGVYRCINRQYYLATKVGIPDNSPPKDNVTNDCLEIYQRDAENGITTAVTKLPLGVK